MGWSNDVNKNGEEKEKKKDSQERSRRSGRRYEKKLMVNY